MQCYLLITLRRPPVATLFPYTTLFRSLCRRYMHRPEVMPAAVGVFTYFMARGEYGTAGTVLQDRKSTRLNSSHVAISYAVFCLKKKNYVRSDESRLHAVLTELKKHSIS